MSFSVPTVADFKIRFNRDFPYAPASDPNNLDFVGDVDIQNAINEALIDFPYSLFGDNSAVIFLLLAAHFLVCNIRNSQGGLAAQARFILGSTSVGGVSFNNTVSERFAQDPIFASLLKTGYGQRYLDMAYPYTVGNVGISCGQSGFN